MTTFDEFRALTAEGTFVPVCREIMADLLTPVSAFLRIAAEAPHAFLFESVEGGEQVARYSFLGKDPVLVLEAESGRSVIEREGVVTEVDEAPLETLRRLTAEFRAPSVPGLPRFTGGAVGYLGYEAACWFEPVALRSLAAGPGPAALFMLFDTILAFDHVQHRILIIANALVTPGADLRALYEGACTRIAAIERGLQRELPRSQPGGMHPGETEPRANMTREEFERKVREVQEHIVAGDIYQAVLSQRFELDTSADSFRVYRALRHVSPSPYMFYLRTGSTAIAGASPEMLVRVEQRHVETHPIAGTRPRGASAGEDERLADELRGNEKERAEHVMLVDLARNDIGRVSAAGSVRVPRFMALERYSHVMHLVSVVEGRLADGRDRLDALTACFPAGTVTGAPKIRAMQIIAGLEPTPRGIYAGAIGYVDFAGNLDFCIAIRTLVLRNGRAAAQAGAGIVADSVPSAEYDESRQKARSLVQALALAASDDW